MSELVLALANESPLPLMEGLPVGYRGPLLQGAHSAWARTLFADIVIQEFISDDYSIRLFLGKIVKRLSAKGWLHSRGLYTTFMLKNGARKNITAIGKLHVREDQYSGFVTNPADCDVVFEKNIDFQALDFFYSPSLLQELLPYFPQLAAALASEGTLLAEKTYWTLPSMKEITHQLLHSPFDASTRRFYFDLKVRELLYQILTQVYQPNSEHLHFTPYETARIHEARTILQNSLASKPPTLKALTKLVALNALKLKTGFKYYFHAAPFEWLLEAKMQEAKRLILTTNKPIKEICTLVGYPRTTNFITAFRRRFGVTPRAMRLQ